MRRALTTEQTRLLEERAADALGVSVGGLMSLVGKAVAEEAASMAPSGRIVVLTGKGNNAGDGWVAAHVLHAAGRDARVIALVDPMDLPEPARTAANEAAAAGVAWQHGRDASALSREFAVAELVVDALFGFGLHGALDDPFASVVGALEEAGTPVLAVDLPSGVEADSAAVRGPAVTAERTLAVLALKIAHVEQPAAQFAGDVVTATLGVAPEILEQAGGLEFWEEHEIARALPRSDPEDHKGSRGRVLIVGGSGGMTGSISLACMAALRSGAGYVTAAVPASVGDIVDSTVVPAVVRALPETGARALDTGAIDAAAEWARHADVVVLGPGIGSTPEARGAVRGMLERIEAPVVLDADGLNAVAEEPAVLGRRQSLTIVTPHPGEAGRLLGITSTDVQANRPDAARRIADLGAVCLLKGPGTLVCSSERCGVITTGTAALATMGTGDILSGMVGAFLAAGLGSFEAPYVAAFVHGIAGAAAGERLTDICVTATDVLDSIPAALATVRSIDHGR
jgi:NAD(P)H-hydrate epimerase